MKVIYHGPLWSGSTSLQRFEAFEKIPGMEMIASDTGWRVGGSRSLWFRARWRLRFPADINKENHKLLSIAADVRPDVVFIDGSKVIHPGTLKTIRGRFGSLLVYYTPDNILAPHNSSWFLRRSFPLWDILFTTKPFTVSGLSGLGVRYPYLIGKAYDPVLHRPMRPEEVGENYERYDLVFIGTFEAERLQAVNVLAEAGFSVALFGSDKGGWSNRPVHPAIDLYPSVFAQEYTRCMHYGKIALSFLRKINKDRFTQRSMEIAAMGRPMLAEKTEEHDEHFMPGNEYMGFENTQDLVAKARMMLKDDHLRRHIGAAGRERCLRSGYSTIDRAQTMVSEFKNMVASIRSHEHTTQAAK